LANISRRYEENKRAFFPIHSADGSRYQGTPERQSMRKLKKMTEDRNSWIRRTGRGNQLSPTLKEDVRPMREWIIARRWQGHYNESETLGSRRRKTGWV